MGVAGLGDHPVEHRLQIGILGRLFPLAGGKAQIGVDHPFHFGKIGPDRRSVLAVVHQFELQADAGQRSAKVVADAGQHFRPLVELAHDAVTHRLEGTAGKPYLARALKPVIRCLASKAKCPRGVGKPQNRPYLAAHEQQGNGKEQDRGAKRPAKKGPAGRGEDPLAAGIDSQYAGIQCQIDKDKMWIRLQIGVPFLFQPDAQLIAKHFLGIACRRIDIPPRKFSLGIVLDGEGEILPSGLLDQLDRGLVRRLAKPVGKQADVSGKLARHVACDRVPMSFIEDEDGDHLHQNHRHQNDRQHAPEQRFRQIVTKLHCRPRSGCRSEASSPCCGLFADRQDSAGQARSWPVAWQRRRR